MDTGQFEAIGADRDTRLEDAIKKTAPGTALRHALDMIIAGHMGALICVGDTDNVLAAGDDGFKLDVSTSTQTRRCPRPRREPATARPLA